MADLSAALANGAPDTEQIARRGAADPVRVGPRLACLNRAGRPVRLPDARPHTVASTG